jgi:antitoxin component YwqK of YwqJK toxin-antitoxin module
MRIIFLCILLLFVATSCKNKNITRIITRDYLIAEGKISKDTIFDGVIRFYDLHTRKLRFKATYDDGILNGEKIDYYSDGKIYAIQNYVEGKLNGDVKFLSRKGAQINIQHYYFNLPVGARIKFTDGKIATYDFYSLDGTDLLSINYDSLKGRKITDFQEAFFFYHINDFGILNGTDSTVQNDLFIYLPQPPKLKFEYSLVQIDNQYKVISEEKKFTINSPWDLTNLPSIKREDFALRLIIRDSLNGGGTYTMFKKL